MSFFYVLSARLSNYPSKKVTHEASTDKEIGEELFSPLKSDISISHKILVRIFGSFHSSLRSA